MISLGGLFQHVTFEFTTPTAQLADDVNLQDCQRFLHQRCSGCVWSLLAQLPYRSNSSKAKPVKIFFCSYTMVFVWQKEQKSKTAKSRRPFLASWGYSQPASSLRSTKKLKNSQSKWENIFKKLFFLVSIEQCQNTAIWSPLNNLSIQQSFSFFQNTD